MKSYVFVFSQAHSESAFVDMHNLITYVSKDRPQVAGVLYIQVL